MNAIDTLREALSYYYARDLGPHERRSQSREALAKLDTLLQAAERFMETKPFAMFDPDSSVYALAAAVRAAKGDTT